LRGSQNSLLSAPASPPSSGKKKKMRASPVQDTGSPTAAGVDGQQEMKCLYTPDSDAGDSAANSAEGRGAADIPAEHQGADSADMCCILHMDSLGMHGTASIGKWLKR
jgi:hypothetical protein